MKINKTAVLATILAFTSAVAGAQCVTQNDKTDCKYPEKDIPYNLMGGPGIVTSISAEANQLPDAAQKFLQTYYSRVMVVSVKKNLIQDVYNVELGNGVKVTFDNKGKVVDIEAPAGDYLYAPAIKAIVHEKTYKHLEQSGELYQVTGIKDANGKGMRILLLNNMPPEMLFDVDGLFIIVDD